MANPLPIRHLHLAQVLNARGQFDAEKFLRLFNEGVLSPLNATLPTLTTEKRLTEEVTWNPGSVADGAQTTTTVEVSGAELGDTALASFSRDIQGQQLTAYVSATDEVTVVLRNGTGGAVDLDSGTLRVDVWGA